MSIRANVVSVSKILFKYLVVTHESRTTFGGQHMGTIVKCRPVVSHRNYPPAILSETQVTDYDVSERIGASGIDTTRDVRGLLGR